MRSDNEMKKTAAFLLAMAALAVPSAALSQTGAQAKDQTAAVGKAAGKITALLPTVHVARGRGKAAKVSELAKGDTLLWDDLIRTEKGGRARITLLDQSILSLGSQAELRIIRHDSKTQQTALELGYGRLRAEVASLTRDGSKFEVRTPTAVAGVIGTDFGSDSSVPGTTTFVCISGLVQVANTDPKVGGSVACSAGMTTTVQTGKSPTAPKPATQDQVQQLIQDTEPATISSMAPSAFMVGSSVDALLTGAHMANVTGVTIAPSDKITAALDGAPTEAQTKVKLQIAADAAAGTRTMTLSKANGQNSIAVFAVISPDLKGDASQWNSGFVAAIEQERQSGVSALNAIVAAVQQAIDQGTQQFQAANSQGAVNANAATDAYAQVLKQLTQQIGGSIQQENDAAAEASRRFSADFAAALAGLKQRDAQLKPDQQFVSDVTKAFQSANDKLMLAFNAAQAAQAAQVEVYLAKVQQSTEQLLAMVSSQANERGPVAQVDKPDQQVEIGNTVTLDASRSQAFNGASVASYQWAVCTPDSYQAKNAGTSTEMKPGQGNPCSPYNGLVSNAAQFDISACQLENFGPDGSERGGDYTAHLIVTDSNGKKSYADALLHVLTPSYASPRQRMYDLAAAYMSLQPSNYIAFFDDSYPALNQLQQNVQRTFPTLNSMSINVTFPTQPTINCNDSNLVATFQQNYTFRDQTCTSANGGACSPAQFTQNENLQVRMSRRPGQGWFINDMSGDTGTVTGTPGPTVSDAALPDLQVTNVTVAQAAAGRARQSVANPVGLSAGSNTFVATVQNVGQADLTQQPNVLFALRDAAGNLLVQDTEAITLPLKAGQSTTVRGTLSVPTSAQPGSTLSLVTRVNPDCVVAEKLCGTDNLYTTDAVLGSYDLSVASITAPQPLIGTLPGLIVVTIDNLGTVASPMLPGGLTAGSSDFAGSTKNYDVPSIPPGGSAAININFNVDNVPGPHPVTATVNGAADNNPVNNTLNSSVTFLLGVIDLKASNLSLGSASAFNEGQAVAISATVTNSGNGMSSGADSLACSLIGTGTQTTVLPVGSANVPPISPGASTTVHLNGVVPQGASALSSPVVSCTVSQDPYEAAGTLADNTVTTPITLGLANFVVSSLSFNGHTSPATGVNAANVGELLSAQLVVSNSGAGTPGGQVTVAVTCAAPCALPAQTVTVSAPPAGQSATAPISFGTVSAPLGSFTVNASITAAPAQSSTADDTLAAALDVTDFAVSAASTTQNMRVGVQSVLPYDLSFSGPAATAAVNVISQDPGVSLAVAQPSGPGTYNVGVTPLTNATTGVDENLTVAASRNGVSHSATAALRFFTSTMSVYGTNLAGDTPASPLIVATGSNGATLTLQLNGNFSTANSAAQLSVDQLPAGVSANFEQITSANPGDQIPLLITTTSTAAANTVQSFRVRALIPNTNPPDYTDKVVYIVPSSQADVSITAAAFAPSDPHGNGASWISGEPADFAVTLKNSGNAATPAGASLVATLQGRTVGTLQLPSIAAGGQSTVTIHAVAPDPVGSGTSTITFEYVSGVAGDPNTANNSLNLNLPTSDWSLAAINGSPVSLVAGTGGSRVGVGATFYSGTSVATLNLAIGLSNSQITVINVAPLSASTTFQETVTMSAQSGIASGPYYVQLIATEHDGQLVTAKRQVTIPITVTATAQAVPVTLTTDRGNDASPISSCVTPCTPIQINGLLVENENLTVNGPAAGYADLNFTSGQTIVSNVTANGTALAPGLSHVVFGTPQNVGFAASEDGSGDVLPGIQFPVMVSATAAQLSAVNGGPEADAVNPVRTLYFNVGDIYLNSSASCISLAPGASGTLQLGWTPIAGFNAPALAWSWSALPAGVSSSVMSATTAFSAGTYSGPQITLTNSNPAALAPSIGILSVTISNQNGSATKQFQVIFGLDGSTLSCTAAVARGVSAGTAMPIGPHGHWVRGASSMMSRVNTSPATTAAGVDVQFDPAVPPSFSPSLPQAGEPVQLRFKLANRGKVDAQGVVVALKVGGAIVAQDTFDIRAGGSTLAGLTWPHADLGTHVATTAMRGGIRPMQTMPAILVIDPAGKLGMTSAPSSLARRSAVLRQFSVVAPPSAGLTALSAGGQREIVQMADGACAGFRFDVGSVANCEGAAVSLSVEDLAQSRLRISSEQGLADLGLGGSAANLSYSSQALLTLGHTYAVRLSNGRVGMLTISAIRNPAQLQGIARKAFQNHHAAIAQMGSSSGPAETGGIAQVRDTEYIYLDVRFHVE